MDDVRATAPMASDTRDVVDNGRAFSRARPDDPPHVAKIWEDLRRNPRQVKTEFDSPRRAHNDPF